MTPRSRSTSQGHSALSGDVLSRAFGLAPDTSGSVERGPIEMVPEVQNTPRTTSTDYSQVPRRNQVRDSVAFLLGRAPETLQPPLELKALQVATPRGLREMVSSMKSSHDLVAIEGADPLDDRYTRKRDRVTEYLEILNQQSHIVRKK